ncbi:Tat pathway signal protein, partial [Halobacteriales archaeon SW_5_68_122]
QDALLHLTSDRADVVLEAEEALFGDREAANGIEATAFPGRVDHRRTGFIGRGMPAERADEVDGIPEDAEVPDASKLFVGFNAGFAGNQASEAFVTLDSGPFEGGTTKHVSTLQQRLDRWYEDNNHEEMVKKLFSTDRAGDIEGVGDNVGANSGVTPADAEELVEAAREHGAIGHAQKMARANRDDEGNFRTLRRHVESTDQGIASLHFPSLQREISTFEEIRQAMNATDVVEETPAIRQRVNNGILRYVFVKHRGNFLVPPRELRALPTPEGKVP